MQSRNSDLKEFFSHEMQSFPPSLSDLGKLYLPNTKSDLLNCIQLVAQPEPPTICDCRVLDGAAIVHFLPVTGVATFNDYAQNVFIPYLQKQLQSSTRIDIVWDTYLPDSLKESTREKRGKGGAEKCQGKQNCQASGWIFFLILRTKQNCLLF